MKNLSVIVCLVFAWGAAGCQSKSSTKQAKDAGAVDASTVDASTSKEDSKSADSSTADPQARAIAAKKALAERLSGKLVRAMSTQGPAAAIEVCSNEAMKIAKTIGEKHGVKIGRTSLKLRNPLNEPPEWVKPLLEEASAEPQIVELPAGRVGVLLPIKLQAKCLTCHGPTDQIPDAILAQLAEHYPKDQATGFQVDDLRGWFWVEVPSTGATP